jgi:hypothetical protein
MPVDSFFIGSGSNEAVLGMAVNPFYALVHVGQSTLRCALEHDSVEYRMDSVVGPKPNNQMALNYCVSGPTTHRTRRKKVTPWTRVPDTLKYKMLCTHDQLHMTTF